MPTHDEFVDIPVGDQHIAGTLVAPRTLIPGVLFVHGWGGSQQQYVARARTLAALGLRLPHVRPARTTRKRVPSTKR